MTIFDVLTLIGGLCLFLFGMNIMGQSLERRAGNSLRSLLSKMTTKKLAGFLTGCGITCVIQSSSATTVMVVGFVNSGLMTLKQATNVIIGANVGTTITGWILSLGGISSDNTWIRLLKPSSFTPVLALIGIVYYMFCKSSKKKDTGTILLGFATLMFGMETMSNAVSGLADVPQFQQLFLMFKNPLLGLLAGAVLTAVIQSSSASVGILQALAFSTGQVSYGAAIPILMGDAIGTCITALLSCIGTKKEAKRAAVIHLSFNIIGATVWLIVYCVFRAIFQPLFLDLPVSMLGIAAINTIFKCLNTAMMLPISGVLEKIAYKIIPESKDDDDDDDLEVEIDERLLASPPIALQQCQLLANKMAKKSVRALKNGLISINGYTPEIAEKVRRDETTTDQLEDILGTFLIKISACQLSEEDSDTAAKLLKSIGDFERISDHAVNLLEVSEEMYRKKLSLSGNTLKEFEILSDAVNEILDMSLHAFTENDINCASNIEPLEEVIDNLKEKMRTHHIKRMQRGDFSIELGYIWSDLLTNLERTSDHCSNIAVCLIDTANHNLNLHETLEATKSYDDNFDVKFEEYAKKYAIV